MSEYQIEVENAALLRAIDGAIELLSRPRTLMEAIGGKLETKANLRFDSKTDPAGVPWPQLRPATVNYWYAKKYPRGIPGTLLERTGQLRASLGHNTGDDWVELGTSRQVPGKSQPYWEVGVLHEWGTTIMQPRRIFTADPKTGKLAADDEAAVLQIVNDAILGAFD